MSFSSKRSTVPPPAGRPGRSFLGKTDEALSEPDLLIIDDFGLTALTLAQAEDFDEIVAERHLKSSIIITSNRPPKRTWVSLFPGSVMANSTLDRLAHHAHHFILQVSHTERS